jgi:hypothetical protein
MFDYIIMFNYIYKSDGWLGIRMDMQMKINMNSLNVYVVGMNWTWTWLWEKHTD